MPRRNRPFGFGHTGLVIPWWVIGGAFVIGHSRRSGGYNPFMHPILLATVALVGLPILIHLIMKQEPKRLPFPALRFLQQKKKINQRKMRLRHFLLLLLRVLLIALFGLALFQPTLFSETLNLTGEQPVAVVLVVD